MDCAISDGHAPVVLAPMGEQLAFPVCVKSHAKPIARRNRRKVRVSPCSGRPGPAPPEAHREERSSRMAQRSWRKRLEVHPFSWE